ncbi:LAG1 longevity assurance protein (macronuclear) [Tetrahymena thermophila SB210]|uniref:LAG1 longevity assurance protein n=1 Tax=Tetrahymena thermophila (strain SB210) TaxID=312017 RepID=Q22DI5_TETTS|nr:LAG1 longevity assurance protein [Tetrahymena thermophila SB210]EAR83373.2 LAG1 longevity assurance protein [Tetrahymena thermophila SB210]|eukprot:XP_001031036.2 LAG1 longevity assurance protein [Tetrahymena thermophila SB210]
MKDPISKANPCPPSSVCEQEDEEKKNSAPLTGIFKLFKNTFVIKDFEDFFRILCYIIISIFIFFINSVIQFRQYSAERNIYNIPWSYNILSILVVFLLFGYKKTLRVCLKDWVIRNLNEKYVGAQKEVRANKILKWIQDSTYYSCTTIFSLIAFKDEIFMPSVFGGNGTCSGALSQYPNFPPSNVVLFYHLVQFGCHTYSFFELVLFRRHEDSKFYEFTLHHFMAAGLIFYSGMYNFLYVSVLVLIIHDMGDIFVAGGRFYADMKFKNRYVLYAIMGSALIVWIVSRIFVYPSCIIYTCWQVMGNPAWGVWDIVKYCYYYMFVQLVILFFMHCYWTIFMLKIVFEYSSKPAYKNLYDDSDFAKLKKRQQEMELQQEKKSK